MDRASFPKDLYEFWNKKYFKGKLPDITVKWSPKEFKGRRKKILGATLVNLDTKQATWIKLNPLYRPYQCVWQGTLLHEMVHVEQAGLNFKDRHGRKFQARMKELAARGAFKNLW